MDDHQDARRDRTVGVWARPRWDGMRAVLPNATLGITGTSEPYGERPQGQKGLELLAQLGQAMGRTQWKIRQGEGLGAAIPGSGIGSELGRERGHGITSVLELYNLLRI